MKTFSSGMSRRGDFEPALAAHHSIGIDIQEMSANAITRLAACLVKSSAEVFIDSGAFGNFRAKLRGKNVKPIDFKKVFDKYDALQRAVCIADHGGDEAASRLHFVMPDVVGDQEATLALWREHADEIAGYVSAGGIIPLQGGARSLVEMYDAACEILGVTGLLDIGIPSAAKAVDPLDFAELLHERGDSIYRVHILGAASEKAVAPRLAVLEATCYDGPVSADANRLRSLWASRRGVTRPMALAKLLQLDVRQLKEAA